MSYLKAITIIAFGFFCNNAFAADQSAMYADLESRVSSIEEKNRDFNGRIEQIEYNHKVLLEKLDKLEKDIEYRLQVIEQQKNETKHKAEEVKAKNEFSAKKLDEEQSLGKVQKPNEVVVITEGGSKLQDDLNSPEDKYNQGVKSIKAKDFNEGKGMLDEFIKENKDHKLIPAAYYWTGEAYAAKDDYKNAAVAFLKGYKAAPKGDKASENLLRLSQSLFKLNKKKEACDMVTKIVEKEVKATDKIFAKAKEAKKSYKCS